MDAYLFPRRSSFPPFSAYPSSYRFHSLYGLDRWNSLPFPPVDLPPYSSYALDLLDRPAPFYSGDLSPRGYARPARGFRERGRARRPSKGSFVQRSLGPRQNTFKPKRGGKAVKQVAKAAEKVVQGGKKKVNAEVGKKKVNPEVGKKMAKVVSKEVKAQDTLAKETKELHALWRTAGQKRKLEDEKKEQENAKVSKVAAKEAEKDDTQNSKKARRKKKQKKGQKGPAKKKSSESVSVAEPTDKGKDLSNAGKPEKEKAIKVSLTEEEKNASLDLQRQACKSVSGFLGTSQDSEKTDKEVLPDSGVEKPREEETSEEAQDREEKAFEFFSKILEENQELRKLYVEKCNSGIFECLVCSSIDETTSKTFFNMMSLAMHASKIYKTEKRPEHRGYGRAVCSVLGWNPLRINRSLPKKASDAADGPMKKEADYVETKSFADMAAAVAQNGDDTEVRFKVETEPSKGNVELTVLVSTDEVPAV